MAQYSHFCENCGWSAVNSNGSTTCPSCGGYRVVSSSLDSTFPLYRLNCQKCGWSSGPTTHGGILTCPSCNNSSCVKSTKVSDGGSSSNNNSSTNSSAHNHDTGKDESTRDSFKEMAVVGAFIVGCVLLLFPGLLMTMLIDMWADFESKFWIWVWAIVFSLVVFLFCGFNWKKYLVFDGVIIAIATILCWCIDKFSPFIWSYNHLFGHF